MQQIYETKVLNVRCMQAQALIPSEMVVKPIKNTAIFCKFSFADPWMKFKVIIQKVQDVNYYYSV